MKNLGVKILRKNAKEISSDYYSDVKELSAVYCPSWAFIDILGSALADKILADKSFCDVNNYSLIRYYLIGQLLIIYGLKDCRVSVSLE